MNYNSNVKKFCSRCGSLISVNDYYCPQCTKQKEKEDLKFKKINSKKYNDNRYKDKNNIKIKRFYSSREWEFKRNEVLIRDKYFCVECLKNGIKRRATTVHHIDEIEDAWDKRLDEDNLMSLCNRCHNRKHNRF